MHRDEVKAAVEVNGLFEALVRDLSSREYLMVFGAESFSGPYLQIQNPPERRGLTTRITPENRTTVRLHPWASYLRYLESSFPRLFEQLTEACHRERPFVVVEGWIRYIDLGKRLLSFTREHRLNLRCVDHARRESRLNGIRVHFDQGSHRWRAVAAPVEEILGDPRRLDRSWLSKWDLRWPLNRTVERVHVVVRRAASVVLP